MIFKVEIRSKLLLQSAAVPLLWLCQHRWRQPCPLTVHVSTWALPPSLPVQQSLLALVLPRFYLSRSWTPAGAAVTQTRTLSLSPPPPRTGWAPPTQHGVKPPRTSSGQASITKWDLNALLIRLWCSQPALTSALMKQGSLRLLNREPRNSLKSHYKNRPQQPWNKLSWDGVPSTQNLGLTFMS